MLINNVNVGILDSVFKRFKDSREMAIKKAVQTVLQHLQLEQETHNLKRSVKFDFWLYCWLIPSTFVNKQTLGIILSNHFTRTVANEKW